MSDEVLSESRNLQIETMKRVLVLVLFLLGSLAAVAEDCIIQPMTEPLKLRPGQVYDGKNVVLIASGATNMIELANNCALLNVNIVGDSKCVGIVAKNASRWRVENVRIARCGRGIVIDNSWIGSIADCHLSNCDVGIQLTNKAANAIRVTGGEIAGCRIGVHVTGGEHWGNLVSSCIEGNNVCGILIEGAVESFVVADSYFESNGEADVRIANDMAVGVKCRGNLHLRTKIGVHVVRGIQTSIADNTFEGLPLTIEVGAVGTHVGWNNTRTARGCAWPDLTALNKSRSTTFAVNQNMKLQ